MVKVALETFHMLLVLANWTALCYGAKLQVGFYRGKCGISDVEAIVAGVVTEQFLRDRTIAAALLRLQFHDCFVNGCDASILIDGGNSEKEAIPNRTLRGFEAIDQAKDEIEKLCPGVVSCADLIAIAARDAVFLSGGGRYDVQTGRRDGLVSVAEHVTIIPSPSASVLSSIETFASKGLNRTDMVILLGAHSIGSAHCSTIKDRLYNYQKTSQADPAMDPALAIALRSQCHRNSRSNAMVKLDQMPLSELTLDNLYYKQAMLSRGVLQIDHDVARDPLTRATVQRLADGLDFPLRFGAAMVKLGAVEVLTGSEGEVRRSCRAFNKGHI